MTIDEAIKYLSNPLSWAIGKTLEQQIADNKEATQMAIEALEQEKTNCSEFPNNWIPCSERLPEEYGEYLVTYKSDGKQIFMDIIEYEMSYEFDHEKNRFKGIWLFADDWQALDSEVIAWMPLPKPYQKGEQE